MKNKNKVTFTCTDIYLFERCLGIDKVPESGNNPLGMESVHYFATREDICIDNNNDTKISTPNSKHSLTNYINSYELKYNDQDSLQSIFSIDYTSKSLQPMSPKQRLKCLKDSGIEFIKDELRLNESKNLMKLRQQRQQVGCKCSGKNQCNPNKCLCSREGIPCQSDSNKFPCKCGPSCGNILGRRVYSHLRTKYHYRHTFEKQRDFEISEYPLIFSEKGDCQFCNIISEESLNEIFLEPKISSRKRSAKTQDEEKLLPPISSDCITMMPGSKIVQFDRLQSVEHNHHLVNKKLTKRQAKMNDLNKISNDIISPTNVSSESIKNLILINPNEYKYKTQENNLQKSPLNLKNFNLNSLELNKKNSQPSELIEKYVIKTISTDLNISDLKIFPSWQSILNPGNRSVEESNIHLPLLNNINKESTAHNIYNTFDGTSNNHIHFESPMNDINISNHNEDCHVYYISLKESYPFKSKMHNCLLIKDNGNIEFQTENQDSENHDIEDTERDDISKLSSLTFFDIPTRDDNCNVTVTQNISKGVQNN